MTYKSAYHFIEDEDKMRKIQFFISKDDKNFLTTLVPDHGFMTYLGTRFFQCMAEDFRRKGIYHYDPTNPAFEEVVERIVNTRLGLLPTEPETPQHSLAEADLSSNRGDVTGGKSRRNTTPKGSPKQSSDAKPTTGVGRGTRKRSPKAVSEEGSSEGQGE